MFHNLQNYDGHLIIQNCYLFGAQNNKIPLTPATFLSFKLNKDEYKVSFRCLSEPLYTLVNALRKSKYDFPTTRKSKYIQNDYDLKVLSQKGCVHMSIWIHGKGSMILTFRHMINLIHHLLTQI